MIKINEWYDEFEELNELALDYQKVLCMTEERLKYYFEDSIV